LGIIEIQPHKIYISVSRQLFVQKNSLRALMKTLVSQLNHFEPSFERGNFLNWAKYGDIPSTHGDIPVVFCLIYVIESSKSTKNRFFQNFYPLWEHYFGCSKFRGCRFLWLVRSLSTDSLSMRKLILFGEAMEIIYEVTTSLFQFCSVSQTF